MIRKMAKPAQLIKILLPVAIILALVVAGLSLIKAKAPDPSQSASITPGLSVADFDLFKIGEKNPIRVSSLAAKVYFINFWASWCEACLVEMPSIIKLRSAFKDQGLQIIAVNVDEDPESVVPRMSKQLGLDFQTYYDKDQRLSDLFGISALPYTVILDQQRKVLYAHAGDKDWNSAEVRQWMEKWLKQ